MRTVGRTSRVLENAYASRSETHDRQTCEEREDDRRSLTYRGMWLVHIGDIGSKRPSDTLSGPLAASGRAINGDAIRL